MKAKTIFLNDKDEVIVYAGNFHSENHKNYIDKYYKNLKITDYIPILLAEHNHCVIELSREHHIGVIYLPVWVTEFQRQYFHEVRHQLNQYIIYLNNYSLEHPIDTKKLLFRIDNMPKRKGDYN